MRRHLLSLTAALAFVAIAALGAGCGDDTQPQQPVDGGVDAPVDGGKLAACLDQPTALAKPPTGQLPCELLPPGFAAP